MPEIRLPLKYHSVGQEAIFLDPHPRVVVPAGRRYGKTQGAVVSDVDLAVNEPGSLQLWVDTTQVNIGKYFEQYFRPILNDLLETKHPQTGRPMVHWDRVKNILSFWNGSVIYFGSAERPENLEGFAYRRITLNEAGIILKGEAGRRLWFSTILPMTLVAGAVSQVFFIGTPKGVGLFREFARRGDDPDERRWVTHHRTTHDNPLLSRVEIAELTSEMEKLGGQRYVAQEIHASFMDDDEGTAVIPYSLIEEALHREVEDDRSFRVVWACDPSGSGQDDAALAKRRFNGLLEPVQVRSDINNGDEGARWLRQEYDDTFPDDRPEKIVIDSIGVGQGWVTHAKQLGLPVVPVDWSLKAMGRPAGKAAGLKFYRRKEELWWACRERMPHLSLAGDLDLAEELTKPLIEDRWRDEKGTIKIEPKDVMAKRLGSEGKSPNRADAFVLTFAVPDRSEQSRIDPWRSPQHVEEGTWMSL